MTTEKKDYVAIYADLFTGSLGGVNIAVVVISVPQRVVQTFLAACIDSYVPEIQPFGGLVGPRRSALRNDDWTVSVPWRGRR